MADKTTAITLARQFVDACMKDGVPVFSAWLFGSYAKGVQHDDSDIDLALISDAFTINFIENNHKTALINYRFPDIEVHHFNTQVFKIDDPFINEIKKPGSGYSDYTVSGISLYVWPLSSRPAFFLLFYIAAFYLIFFREF